MTKQKFLFGIACFIALLVVTTPVGNAQTTPVVTKVSYKTAEADFRVFNQKELEGAPLQLTSVDVTHYADDVRNVVRFVRPTYLNASDKMISEITLSAYVFDEAGKFMFARRIHRFGISTKVIKPNAGHKTLGTLTSSGFNTLDSKNSVLTSPETGEQLSGNYLVKVGVSGVVFSDNSTWAMPQEF